MSSLEQFINHPRCDLGPNAWILSDLAQTMKDARFMDLGVRYGASSAVLSVNAKENNNQVCGCDVNFNSFYEYGSKFVDENYLCYLSDSVTLGKNWDEEPFDIIFVDTLHTREIVLAELYFWSNHLKPNGYFVFHDSHWQKNGGDVIGGIEWKRVDEAITDFFNLPTSVMEMDTFETEDISLKHYPESYGMTFIQVKNLDSFSKFKKNIDWNNVFEIRNTLIDMHFNTENPKFINCNLDFESIENELVILP
jgi:SAM-dependent methyltransferase